MAVESFNVHAENDNLVIYDIWVVIMLEKKKKKYISHHSARNIFFVTRKL